MRTRDTDAKFVEGSTYPLLALIVPILVAVATLRNFEPSVVRDACYAATTTALESALWAVTAFLAFFVAAGFAALLLRPGYARRYFEARAARDEWLAVQRILGEDYRLTPGGRAPDQGDGKVATTVNRWRRIATLVAIAGALYIAAMVASRL